MRFWQNSLIYRLGAGSWLMGWLFAPPGQEKPYYEGSKVYGAILTMTTAAVRWLQKVGAAAKKLETGSILVKNPIGFLGMLLFFYFAFDVVLHQYVLTRKALEIMLALAGLFLTLLHHWPGLWQGTLVYRLLKWWQDTD